MSCGQCETCIAPEGWVCKESGNFYTTGEYANIIEFYKIHGVSFNQKVDSVKELLDYDTLQILKVLLQDIDAPAKLGLEATLNIVATIELIQSRLPDNKGDTETIVSNINSTQFLLDGGDEE